MKIEAEKIALALFLIVALFVGPGTVLDHNASHEMPYGYGASDAFQHQVRADAIADMGKFRYEARYISRGFEGIEGRYPPLLYHLSIILASASGLEIYDAIYLLVLLMSVFACLALYFIIAPYHKIAAMLTLPFCLLIFSFPASLGYLYGHWPSLLSQCFLVLFFWAVMRRDLDGSWLLIGISLAGVALTHTSEAIFAAIFLIIACAIWVLSKSLSKKQFIQLFFGGLFGVALFAYYGIIFLNTWAIAQPFTFSIDPLWEGNPGFYMAGFGALLVLFALGFFVALKDWKLPPYPFIIGFSMLLCGYLNYIGFQFRSFQLRFFWPLYLAIFFGVGLYLATSWLVKRGPIHSLSVFSLFIVLLSGFISYPVLGEAKGQAIPLIPAVNLNPSQGMMDPYHWEALRWVAQNTEERSLIYFFYGDIYSQDALLRNTKRDHLQADPTAFIEALQSRKVLRTYVSERPGDNGGGTFKRVGLFTFENVDVGHPQEYYFGEMDVCIADYFVLDVMSRQDVLAQYNKLIAAQLINRSAEVVFQNQVVAILKNNNKGGECIEEREF